METFQAVTTRRSIRKFKPDQIPEQLLREILEAARWTPSWGNTQPWEIAIVTGNTLDRFRMANRQRILGGAASTPDTTMPESWPEPQKQRYGVVGKQVLTALAIPREDKEARIRYAGDMYALFSAPALILFCVDKSIPREYAMLDTGAIMQTFCLLAQARGIGSCILAASVRYPDLIREVIPIPDTRAVIIGVAVGYPDVEAPVNRFTRERANTEEFTLWFK